MKHYQRMLIAISLIILSVTSLHGCRRVALVGDSLLGCAREAIVTAINENDGESWVYTEHVWGGSTAWNNPINQEIYGAGLYQAFHGPDVLVFSFASNDMGRVAHDVVTMDSAVQSMQALINQSVAAGAMCVVMLESSHRLRGDHQLSARFELHMDEWFDYWHQQVGDKEYLGIPYTLLIANISQQVESDMDLYIADYIHFTEAGALLAASAITEQINLCPEGRWIFGTAEMVPGASYPQNPFKEYGSK